MWDALKAARVGLERGEMPIGAVVVVNDGVMAEAHLQEMTQRRLLAHADLLALDAADRLLGSGRQDARLYVTLEPCVMCLGAAFTAKVGTVVYGLESPTDGGSRHSSSGIAPELRLGCPDTSCPTSSAGYCATNRLVCFCQWPAGSAQWWPSDPPSR